MPLTATYSRVAGENASPPTYHITATLARRLAALDNYIITNDWRGVHHQQAPGDVDDESSEQDLR